MADIPHKLLRGLAVAEFGLALGCLFYAAVFLLSPPVHDELGLAPTLRLPFVVTGTGAACLLTYGGIHNWRGSARWWPLAVALVGTPIVFILLWVVAAA